MTALEKLVYPATTEQELYRVFCEEVPIGEHGYYEYDVEDLSPQLVFGADKYPEYVERLRQEKSSREAFRRQLITRFDNYDGRNICGWYNPRHYANPGIRMWRSTGKEEPLATDIITTGAGIVRPHISEVRTGFAYVFNERKYPRQVPTVQSRKARVLQTHLIHYASEICQVPQEITIRYDSTNLLYGDIYGELKQVYARRNDTKFLEVYLKWVQTTWRERLNVRATIIDGLPTKGLEHLDKLVTALGGKVTPFPGSHIDDYKISPDGNCLIWKKGDHIVYRIRDLEVTGCCHLAEAPFLSDIGSLPRGFLLYVQHMLDHGMWRKPPETVEELLIRVECLLSITEVDKGAYNK